MALSTVSAASQIAPVVLATFFRHFHRKLDKDKRKNQNDPSNDIIFDQAFHIVKKFMDICTHNNVESIQSFSNTHIPSPPWSITLSDMIPMSCCNKAANYLINNWFTPEELDSVVGGRRWWQVRGIDGIEAEWIAMRSHVGISLREELVMESNKAVRDGLNKLKRTVLFIHGGAFYWGSINTHRYQILRIARKVKGRCFAVNYRKAPQYPWPCALQDVLAAYLYLIDPPPSALHDPIPANEIVFAGDSAGGGLCLSLLTLLRDMSLPMPAGAVLISPWVDLTHSFPSVMDNTKTDIIPKYGFIHKPSTCWPVPIATAAESEASGASGSGASSTVPNGSGDSPALPTAHESRMRRSMKLASQIQLYATNEQLTHPLVSPLLQGSLGGLCPLYILAGEQEVLRDEIIYLAHRAAHPDKFPVRKPLVSSSSRQEENVKRFNKPTQIRLQIYDGMPHVMTVYSFYPPVKYAYRAIAGFVRQVCVESTTPGVGDTFPTRIDSREGEGEDTGDSSDEDNEKERPSRGGTDVRSASPTSLSVHNHSANIPHRQPMAAEAKSQSLPTPVANSEPERRKQPSELTMPSLLAERVDLAGVPRPLEAMELIPALQIPTEEIGIIKDVPAQRYMDGQGRWDKTFGRTVASVAKRRQKYRERAAALVQKATDLGILDDSSAPIRRNAVDEPRWWPLDLQDENPPPSAIAGRTDTSEAVALLRACLKSMGMKESTSKLRRAPRPSPSEGQVYNRWLPFHGLKMWEGIISVFAKETKKRSKKIKASRAQVNKTETGGSPGGI